jgi:hypothetical protein
MSGPAWNVLGLVMALIGILLLFRYGMPYRVRRGGQTYELREEIDEAGLKQEHIYDVLGWIGLLLIIFGTLAQIRASLL